MAERYTRLYALNEKYYTEGAPVLLEAGALLRDNKTGKLLAQLKFRNLSDKVVKLLSVKVFMKDSIGRPLQKPVEFRYLDLIAGRNETFGTKQAIELGEDEARSFEAAVVEAGFADNTLYTGSSEPWKVLSTPQRIGDFLKDQELEKQYRIHFGRNCDFRAKKVSDLWYCTCGTVNRRDEKNCCQCARASEQVLELDLEGLNAEKEARLAEEETARRDAVYEAAKKLMDIDRIREYEEAIEKLQSIPSWKDSEDQVEACRKRIAELEVKAEEERLAEIKTSKTRKVLLACIAGIAVLLIAFGVLKKNVIDPSKHYKEAVSLMEAGSYEEAIEAFEALGEYKDSVGKIEECKTGILDDKYNAAIALMETGSYEEAIEAFEALGEYKDSAGKIEECKTGILDDKYNAAIALMEVGSYEEAAKVFEALRGHRDSTEKADECKIAILEEEYNTAVALMDSGINMEAFSIFEKLGEYRDSAERAKEISSKYSRSQLMYAEVGDAVFFGTYEQDNDLTNGKEAIQWIVLAKEEGKILVVSKYALDCQKLNESRIDTTWDKSSLRTWLNDTFQDGAFSKEEQSLIVRTTVLATENTMYSESTWGIKYGGATEDKIFLLSAKEAEKYFGTNESRVCEATAYALAQGTHTKQGEQACNWWLRTPGTNTEFVTVWCEGAINYNGDTVTYGTVAVRPAIWLSVE